LLKSRPLLDPSIGNDNPELTPPATPSRRSDRMIQLDVLRGVAILLVLGYHTVVDSDSAGLLRLPARVLGRAGWTGVDLFFVLSGFLVGGLLLSEFQTRGSVDLRRFAIRRMFKIWPGYYLLVLSGLAIDGPGRWRRALQVYLPNFLHLQNYGRYFNRIDHTWSLAVEEHFYIALPLLIWLLLRFGRKPRPLAALPWIALAIVVGCNIARLVVCYNKPFNLRHNSETQLRMDSLAFGVLLAYFYHFQPWMIGRIGQHRWAMMTIGLTLIAPMGIFDAPTHFFVTTIGYTMLYVGYGCILLAAVFTPVGKQGGLWGLFFASRLARVLATFGVYSYSIYLWHFGLLHDAVRDRIIPQMMPEEGAMKWLIGTGLYVLLSFLAGMAMAKIVEFPALALRNRLYPARSTPLSNADPAVEMSSPWISRPIS
jgi:peptidoglycan/LPS O-acetylase OafA/YrhL